MWTIPLIVLSRHLCIPNFSIKLSVYICVIQKKKKNTLFCSLLRQYVVCGGWQMLLKRLPDISVHPGCTIVDHLLEDIAWRRMAARSWQYQTIVSSLDQVVMLQYHQLRYKVTTECHTLHFNPVQANKVVAYNPSFHPGWVHPQSASSPVMSDKRSQFILDQVHIWWGPK